MIVYIIFLSFITSFTFAQEAVETNPSQEITQEEKSLDSPVTTVILPELGELKLKYLSEEISLEEIYRLASFYMTENIYHKASELYGQYIDIAQNDKTTPLKRMATASYNRALALFSLNLYQSALPLFMNSYYYDNTLIDALRMQGTIYFLQKNKNKTIELWKKYLEEAPESPQKKAIQDALNLISDPAFSFDSEEEEKESELPEDQQTWPFLNPDIIPNPDANYQKKRII